MALFSISDDGPAPNEPRAMPLLVRLFMVAPPLLWFGWAVFDIHLNRSRPLHPDASRGFIIPQTEHGITIYLSEVDHLWIQGLFWGAIGIFAVAALLHKLATRASLPVAMNWLRHLDHRQYRTSDFWGWSLVVAVVIFVAYLLYGS